jgi:hypothetical protein
MARFAEIHRVGVYRVHKRLLQAGLLLVIGVGTYVHYMYVRVRSSENSTAGTYRDAPASCEIVDGSWVVV